MLRSCCEPGDISFCRSCKLDHGCRIASMRALGSCLVTPACLALVLSLLGSATAAALAVNNCSVTAEVTSHWALSTGDNQYAASISLLLSNNGTGTIAVPYDISVEGVGYSEVVQALNFDSTGTSTGVINGTASLYWETLLPLGGNTVNLGLIIQTTSNASNVAPTAVSIAGKTCNLNITQTPGAAPAGGAIESGSGSLTTSGGNIIGPDGNVLNLLGINFFGFDDGNTMVDGLWAGSDQLTLDFATVVYRIQLLGFNAVRLPFSFQNLYNAAPKSQTQTCSAVTTEAILSSVTYPGKTDIPADQPVPTQASPAAQTPGVCNDYVPSDTTLDRFAWVVSYLAANDFYILLDNQFNLDTTVLDDYQQWLTWWPSLISTISQDATASLRIMVDILNEPDCNGLEWSAANGKPGAGDLYLAAMDAIYAVNPNVLFFIEGTGQSGLADNWGDGLCTDASTISSYGISDPNPFFTTLMGKQYLDQVVIAPHIYPPSISKATSNYAGSGLFNRLSLSFGTLNKAGYCLADGTCHQFAVCIGETGTAFTNALDTPAMTDFASYLTNTGSGADGLHNAISNVFWWAWNANSGDTKGLVQDDWLTVNWNKVDWLASVGLAPWYANQFNPSSTSSSSSAAIESYTEPSPPTSGDGFSTATNTSSSGTNSTAIAAESSATAGLTTVNASVIGVSGLAIDLVGVTWPGFDDGNTMFDGLLDSASSFSQDFQTQVQRILSLGFNMVKIPFSFNDLSGLQPLDFVVNCTLPTTAQLQSSVTNPNVTSPPGRSIPALNASAATVISGTCNSYLPNDSVLDRFLYVVDFLATNNLYVVLSNNVTADNTVAVSPSMWIQSWATLVTAVSAYSASKSHLILDFIDYPDKAGLKWEANNGLPGSGDLYLAAMEATNPINPDALFMIKGADQSTLTTNGGQGFVTSQTIISESYSSNPNAFFRTLLSKSYSTQVILAPIVEPPSQTGMTTGFFETPLYATLSEAFGYMNDAGYCATGGVCKNFPLLLEIGSPLTSLNDQLMMESLANYMTLNGLGNDGLHAAIGSFIWNKWTPAAVPTGTEGILTADYVTVDWNKVDYLGTVGLYPWYTLPTAHRTVPVTVDINGTTVNGSTCAVSYSLTETGQGLNTTDGDANYLSSLQLTLTNLAVNAPIAVPYTVTVNNTAYTGVTQSFGLNLTDSTAKAGVIAGSVPDYWNILWPSASNNITVSMLVQGSSIDLAPAQVLINSLSCELTDATPASINSGPQPSAAGTTSGGV